MKVRRKRWLYNITTRIVDKLLYKVVEVKDPVGWNNTTSSAGTAHVVVDFLEEEWGDVLEELSKD